MKARTTPVSFHFQTHPAGKTYAPVSFYDRGSRVETIEKGAKILSSGDLRSVRRATVENTSRGISYIEFFAGSMLIRELHRGRSMANVATKRRIGYKVASFFSRGTRRYYWVGSRTEKLLLPACSGNRSSPIFLLDTRVDINEIRHSTRDLPATVIATAPPLLIFCDVFFFFFFFSQGYREFLRERRIR